jgi:hypothetical protein
VERPVVRKGGYLEAKFLEFFSLNTGCPLLFIYLLDSLPLLRGPLFNFEIVALAWTV